MSPRLALLSLLCVPLCGCQTLVSAWKEIIGESSGAAIDIPEPETMFFDGPRVKPGVALTVQIGVPSQKSTVMDVLVDEKGEITLPYLLTEPVECNGITLDALRQKLTKAYKSFIKQPQVTVHFAPFDQKTGVSPYGTVKVLGEVASPGPVNMPPTMDLTVTKAIQAAGGLRTFANKRKIRVTRRLRDGSLQTVFVDLIEIGEGGRSDKDLELKPGDVVYAHETYW
ncbi:MAG: polysaccharide biosynthesis/export family protein [Kiritimatiellae bacterium]|nr:polysaccharide biosynthesis/export family protein [Kiritimatiellia bacterium]